MEKKTQNSIANNIKKYRLLNNMTQKELSEKLYLDTQYYAQLERGERNFSIEKIAMICSLF
ncbi:MAG: helix-turn-helix transcriptional regulator, partial [Lachnospiraceae bacterium]|nr:helix-turn-helix transcriptional regulator [Lachnospiraceae bacterium]